MAITATFAADFTALKSGVDEATAKLRQLEGGADQARAKLDTMITGMSAAGRASATAAPKVGSMVQSFAQVDSMLGSVGVHLGPQVKGLAEMGAVSGMTAASLGTMGVAGAVLAAGITGWKIGRAAADFFGLDDAVASVSSRLLGFGDLAAEVAGAQADALNMAFVRTATNAERSATAVAVWNTELAAVTASGDMDSLTADLESQNFSVASLAERYHVSVEALQFFVREQASAVTATEDANARIEASNAKKLKAVGEELAAHKLVRDSLAELDAASVGYQVTLDALDGEVVEAIKYYTDAGVSQGALAIAYGLTAEQIRNVVGALGDEKVAIQDVTKAEADRAQALEARNAKEQADRRAMLPSTALKERNDAIMHGGTSGGGGWTDIHGKAVTAIAGTGGGTMINNIYVNGTGQQVAQQMTAELIKQRKLKGLI